MVVGEDERRQRQVRTVRLRAVVENQSAVETTTRDENALAAVTRDRGEKRWYTMHGCAF